MNSFAQLLFLFATPLVTGFSTSARRRASASGSSTATSVVQIRHDIANVTEMIPQQGNVGTLMEDTGRWSRPSTYEPADDFVMGESPFPDLMMDEFFDHQHHVPQESPMADSTKEKVSDITLATDSVNEIIRDLNGSPLTNEYFSKAMGIDRVDAYSCPEHDTFRGFMSNAGRVYLQPGGETAFYKRILFSQLPHAQEKQRTAPHKLVRDAKSYQVVARFLQSRACQQVMEATHVVIPKVYDAQMQPDFIHPMESKFTFLMQDLSPADGWYQTWLLDNIEECQATLSTFAKIHAYFWEGSEFWKDVEVSKELETAIWESGSYVQPTAQNIGQCQQVKKEWAKKRMRFVTDLSHFDFWDNLGERLESVAEDCGRLAHPFAHQEDDPDLYRHYRKYRTFTHGDPKQANLLFRREGPSNVLQVGLIDFQWSGFGLAATDIAHLITSAVHASLLVNGGEEQLLRYYYSELENYLVEFRAYPSTKDVVRSYNFDTFLEQYETAVLDICRLMIAYTWDRLEEPVTKDDNAACARTMNKTSYNKSIPTIIWLLRRCHDILQSRGV